MQAVRSRVRPDLSQLRGRIPNVQIIENVWKEDARHAFLLPEAAVRKPKTFCLLSSPFLTLIYTLLAAAIRPVPREAVRDRRAVAETIRPDQNSYRTTARRGQLLPGDQMLIGLDLIKDDPRLLLAYDDATGITGAFNLNLLARLSRELDANFQLRNFKYLAIWNASESRIEMHKPSVMQPCPPPTGCKEA